ncbi:MAG: HDOD domain-containing protein [Pseudomonadota bacterium]
MTATAVQEQTNLEKAEKLIKSIGIPAQPKLVLDIDDELKQAEPDIGKITGLISQDPALTAKIIRVVNSPFFGTRKQVDSVKQALTILGLTHFKNVVIASALSEALRLDQRHSINEPFWNHSILAARIAAFIARRLFRNPAMENEAYIAGLFHDCAVPLLAQKFPDYLPLAPAALNQQPAADSLQVEERAYHTNHCAVGYLVAKSWHLPAAVCQAILFHHSPDVDIHADLLTRKLSACLLLAEHINHSYAAMLSGASADASPEAQGLAKALFELDLAPEDLKDLKEDAYEILG